MRARRQARSAAHPPDPTGDRRSRGPAAPREAERFEVESCLARWGLLDRPRPAAGPWPESPRTARPAAPPRTAAAPPRAAVAPPPPEGPPRRAEEAAFGSRLRGALAELGPVFSVFGRYLAGRVDLLAAADCLELSALADAVPPLSFAAVCGSIAAELGRPAEEVFASLAPEPCESRLLIQAHRAELASGQPVLVRLARPDAAEAVERDLPRLALLAGAFTRHGLPAGLFDEALADFQLALRDGADLRATAEALGLLALDAEGFGLLAPPTVRADLCTSRLLTVDDPGGADLALPAIDPADAAGELDAIDALDALDAGGGSLDDARRRRELARLLCVAWLRQALEGRVFPMDLEQAGARLLPGRRLALLAGAFARPPTADRANLRGFLIAMAAREPDEACTQLLREMTRTRLPADSPLAAGRHAANRDQAPAGDWRQGGRDERSPEAAEDELRLLVRQIVPFRDGAWSADGASLAEHVFVCARHARACGFRPRRQLVAFYRGLAAVAAAARRLAPREDVLRDALQEVRVLASYSQVREAMSPPWSEQWGRYAMLMSELPRKLDELLTLAAAGAEPGSGRHHARSAGGPSRREERSHLLLAGALMVLAALALLLHHVVTAAAWTGGRERLAAGLFLTIGGALLWMLARAR